MLKRLKRARNRAALKVFDGFMEQHPAAEMELGRQWSESIQRIIRESGIERKPEESLMDYTARAVNMTPEQLRKAFQLMRDGADIPEAEHTARLTA